MSDWKQYHTIDKCYCHTCEREIGHMGIASHRAMHRRKPEDCDITYNDGRRCDHFFESGQYYRHRQSEE